MSAPSIVKDQLRHVLSPDMLAYSLPPVGLTTLRFYPVRQIEGMSYAQGGGLRWRVRLSALGYRPMTKLELLAERAVEEYARRKGYAERRRDAIFRSIT